MRRFRLIASLSLIVLAGSAVAFTAIVFRQRGRSESVWFERAANPLTLSNLDGSDGRPWISYVSPIAPKARQRIVIRGRGLGLHVPYSHTDSPHLAIRDQTADWAAGRIIPQNYDDVMLDVESWTNDQIVISGFSGEYGRNGWKLAAGDRIQVAVWNPQTGIGPATFNVSIASESK